MLSVFYQPKTLSWNLYCNGQLTEMRETSGDYLSDYSRLDPVESEKALLERVRSLLKELEDALIN